MSESSSSKEGAPAECPVCYEKFQPLEATHRRLSCGHTFCHDCLVKCLLSAKLDGHVQSSITCPVCRYVTFLSEKRALWPATSPRALEVPLSPSSLSQPAKSEAGNTLVVPSHFVLPVQSLERCSPGLPGVLAREAHVFVISEHGAPLGSGQQGGTAGIWGALSLLSGEGEGGCWTPLLVLGSLMAFVPSPVCTFITFVLLTQSLAL
uniref:Ring finger protein 222 n=1 Tax=Ficedula albicollis TaxID=59894 RepID=U3K3J2_FICAL